MLNFKYLNLKNDIDIYASLTLERFGLIFNVL